MSHRKNLSPGNGIQLNGLAVSIGMGFNTGKYLEDCKKHIKHCFHGTAGCEKKKLIKIYLGGGSKVRKGMDQGISGKKKCEGKVTVWGS